LIFKLFFNVHYFERDFLHLLFTFAIPIRYYVLCKRVPAVSITTDHHRELQETDQERYFYLIILHADVLNYIGIPAMLTPGTKYTIIIITYIYNLLIII